MRQELLIAQTWDGDAVPENERATLSLHLSSTALQISVEAPFYGDPAPSPSPGSTWELWNFEVVELFVLGRSEERYLEVELGPHGHHLVLQLHGRRNIVRKSLPLVFEARRSGPRWSGQARVPLDLLPPRPWLGNAYAIHGTGPARRYLAWTSVPGDSPDFHRLDRFAPLLRGAE